MSKSKPLMTNSSGTDDADAAVQSALRTLDAEGSGIAAIPFQAERWARWLRAKVAHSPHSRRCARSAPRSERGRRPSS